MARTLGSHSERFLLKTSFLQLKNRMVQIWLKVGPVEEVFRPLLCPEDIYQCEDPTRRVGHKGRDGFKWASPIPSRPFLRTCAAEIST